MMFSKKSIIKEKVVKYNADKIVKYLCNSKKNSLQEDKKSVLKLRIILRRDDRVADCA